MAHITPSTSLTSKETSLMDPYINYTNISLLILNVIMMIYLSCKLYSLFRAKPISYFERRNRRYRIIIFILIFIGLLLRGAYQGDQIYQAILYDNTAHLEPFALVIDALPSLLFVSIACAFSYFWYALYSSFDEDEEGSEHKSTRFRALLVAVNISLYSLFIACSVLHLSLGSKVLAIIMRSMCVLALIFSTILLKVHGQRLYDRALKLVSYTGRAVKSSSGFRRIYRILLFCCGLKTIKEAVILYFSVFVGLDFLQDLDIINEGYYLPIFIGYVVFFYVIGEYGLFLSLIKLLDSYANKSKISFAEGDPKRTTHESLLLGNDYEGYNQNRELHYNPFSKENNEEASEVSVSLS